MLNADSYPAFGMFAGALGTAAMLASVFATRHAIPRLSVPVTDTQDRHPLLGFITVFATLRQHAFRVLFSTTLMFMVLAGVTQTLLVYTATYLFGFAAEHLALLASSAIIGIVLASPLAQWLSRRLDKKSTLAVCVFVGAGIAFSPQLLWLAGIFQPLELNAKLLLVFSINGLSQAFFIAYVIIVDSMLTDTIDEHELNSGKRAEGLFFAARSLATKASFGIGSFVAGIALDLIEFPTGVEPESVGHDALLSLAVFAGPVSMLLFWLTIAISGRYPLDEARHSDILRRIDEQRSARLVQGA